MFKINFVDCAHRILTEQRHLLKNVLETYVLNKDIS